MKLLNTQSADFQSALQALLAFETAQDPKIDQIVADICADVQKRGDAAVIEYSNRFDGTSAQSMADLTLAQADLQAKQAAQKSAEQTLAQTRAALAKAQQALSSVNQQQRDAWQKLQTLQNELGRLKTEVAGTKAQVARLLSGHYKNRQPNAVMLFLKNAEPGQKERYLQYTRYINQANERVIAQLVQQQAELSAQESAINAEVARLNTLKAQKQAALGKLGRENSAAQTESRALSAQIDNQAKRIAKLRADEQRLNALLADIAKRNAEKRKQEAAARQKAAQARIAAANKARAEQAATTLLAAGFANTKVLQGGMKHWVRDVEPDMPLY